MEETIIFIIATLIVGLICGFITGAIADRKGLSYMPHFFLGFFFTFLGIIIVLIVRGNSEALAQREVKDGNMKKCPHCAEVIKKEANVCRFCGNNVTSSETKAVSSAGVESIPNQQVIQNVDEKEEPKLIGLFWFISIISFILFFAFLITPSFTMATALVFLLLAIITLPPMQVKIANKFPAYSQVKVRFIVIGICLVLVFITNANSPENRFLRNQDIVAAPPPEPFAVYALPSFSKATADKTPHFIKMTISLAYVADPLLSAELETKKKEIEHIVNVLLQQKTYEELNSSSGATTFGEEIKAHINIRLVAGKVKEIYFEEFVVN